jgi:hypothetical protein
MADDARVLELLEEIGNSGCTPEEVCADCPALLPEVRRRWQQMCAQRKTRCSFAQAAASLRARRRNRRTVTDRRRVAADTGL